MPFYGESPEFSSRLLHTTGDGFLVGAGAGSAYHFTRGLLHNAPSGGRLAGAARAVGTNMPRVASRCAAYLAVFCAIETTISNARGRSRDGDRWNSIFAGAATSGLFSLRRGAAATARGALFGATVLSGLAATYWAADLLCSSLSMYRNETRATTPVVPGTAKDEKAAVPSGFLSPLR